MSDGTPRRGISPLGWVAAFTVAAVALAAAYISLKSTPPRPLPPHLEKISKVPAFSIKDQTGKPITLDDLQGKIWVANFIFTRCKGPCPLITQRMADLNTKLGKVRDKVVLVSFSVDPGHDTPEVLAQYGAAQGASPESWKFLAPTQEDIDSIIVKGLLQPVSKEPDGTVAHSSRFVLVDADGWLRGYQDGVDPEVVQKLMVDIGDLLQENTPDKK
jgi:protein SCO1/2